MPDCIHICIIRCNKDTDEPLVPYLSKHQSTSLIVRRLTLFLFGSSSYVIFVRTKRKTVISKCSSISITFFSKLHPHAFGFRNFWISPQRAIYPKGRRSRCGFCRREVDFGRLTYIALFPTTQYISRGAGGGREVI